VRQLLSLPCSAVRFAAGRVKSMGFSKMRKAVDCVAFADIIHSQLRCQAKLGNCVLITFPN
jgi:hypothetical protein